jgi:outer membrane protein assembly factor BamB
MDIGAVPSGRVTPWPAAISAGRIFAMDGDLRISAFDTASGRRLWRAKALSDDALAAFGDVAEGGGAAFGISSDGALVRLDPETGAAAYAKKFPAALKSGLSYCAGRLAFSGDENELYIIDAATGNPVTVHRALNEPFQLSSGPRPVCAGDKIIAAFSNGEVHAVSAKDGKMAWMASVSSGLKSGGLSDVASLSFLVGGKVMAKSYSGDMKVLDPSDGKTIWSGTSGGRAAPASAAKTVFDLSESELRALDAKTGAAIWTVRIGGSGRAFSPVIVGPELLVPFADGRITAYSPADGSVLREVEPMRKITADPVVSDGRLVLQDLDYLVIFE